MWSATTAGKGRCPVAQPLLRLIIAYRKGVGIASPRCYLASYVSRSLPASADGALLVADFAPNSATLGSLVDQRLQLSNRIRCSGLLSLEAADFVLELADAGSGLLGTGSGLFGAG